MRRVSPTFKNREKVAENAPDSKVKGVTMEIMGRYGNFYR
jgi:hypothetical protein